MEAMSLGKNRVGRPARFTREYAVEIAKKLEKWIESPENFWLGSFAVENKMHRQQLSKFVNDFPDELKDAYLLAKQHQENKLFIGAVTNKMNSYMCYAALKNVAGWRDSEYIVDEELPEKSIDIGFPSGSSIDIKKIKDLIVNE
jgi:hypothetical protein